MPGRPSATLFTHPTAASFSTSQPQPLPQTQPLYRQGLRRSNSSHDEEEQPTPFQVALYSRLRQQPATSPPTLLHTDVRPDTTHPQQSQDGSAPNPLHICGGRDHVVSTADSDNTGSRSSQGDVPSGACILDHFSASFVERVRRRLYEQCLTEPNNSNSDAGESNADAHLTPPTEPVRAAPTARTHTPHPPPPSFLNRIQAQLSDQRDRVLTEDGAHGFEAPAVFTSDDAFAVDHHAVRMLFRERHGISLDTLVHQLEQVVESVVRDYEEYFAQEKQILTAAAWSSEAALWEMEKAPLDGTICAPNSSMHRVHRVHRVHPVDQIAVDALEQTPEWIEAFRKARAKWKRLQTSRAAMQRCEMLFGGRNVCRICFDTQVDTALVPCGHVLCNGCAQRVRTCPFCNAMFTARQPVYF
jgi:hypothetical protein